MSVATGSPVSSLLDLDEEMLLTIGEVHAERWTRTEELLATCADLLQVVAYNALVGPHVDPKALKKLKPAAPLDRPGMRRRRRGTTLGDLAEMGVRPQYVGGGDG